MFVQVNGNIKNRVKEEEQEETGLEHGGRLSGRENSLSIAVICCFHNPLVSPTNRMMIIVEAGRFVRYRRNRTKR